MYLTVHFLVRCEIAGCHIFTRFLSKISAYIMYSPFWASMKAKLQFHINAFMHEVERAHMFENALQIEVIHERQHQRSMSPSLRASFASIASLSISRIYNHARRRSRTHSNCICQIPTCRAHITAFPFFIARGVSFFFNVFLWFNQQLA